MIRQTELFSTLPPEWPSDLLPKIRQQIANQGRKLVVLDDDPTGTQTVHNLPVLTGWTAAELAQELSSDSPAFYLLTNSRSLPEPAAQALNREIGTNLTTASQQTGQPVTVVSRSDSTLRGHFPGEVSALAEALGTAFDGWLIVPCFPEGGRFTVGDIHYVAEGENLVPAGETEFARDKSFGYHASNLCAWVAEKSGGTIPSENVVLISIEDLRRGGPQAVQERLLALHGGQVCVVNAVSYRDLEVLVLGLLQAEAAGKRFLYRTAASFVRVRAGLDAAPLLTRKALDLPRTGAGLVVVGSYVPRSSAQLEALLSQTLIETVEIPVERLLDPQSRAAERRRAADEVEGLLRNGRDVVLYTSRRLVSASGAEANLAIGRIVSDSLVEIVQNLSIRPRYLLAKGGITSSDVATRGLGIRRALVKGQILPGVPVWQAGTESRFPGLTYIVFPGNVGGTDALARIVKELAAEPAL